MDGTLVGSDAAVARSWAAWAREYGAGAATAALRGLDGTCGPPT